MPALILAWLVWLRLGLHKIMLYGLIFWVVVCVLDKCWPYLPYGIGTGLLLMSSIPLIVSVIRRDRHTANVWTANIVMVAVLLGSSLIQGIN